MAVTVEYGKCASCNDNNVKSSKVCRSCGSTLPWVAQKAKAPAASPKPAKAAKPLQREHEPFYASIDWGLFGVAAFSFLIPIIGYFLYRSYANQGDERSGVVLTASIVGFLCHVLLRMVLMSNSH